MSPARRALFSVLATALAVLLAGAAAEVGLRLWPPTPRVPIYRLDHPQLVHERFQGVPVWHERKAPNLVTHEDCPATGTTDVLLAGDSVWYVTDPGKRSSTLGERLARALPDGVCVLDGSQPGFVPTQQLAVAREMHSRHGLDALVFLVWKQDTRLVQLGDSLYDVERVVRDPLGTPAAPIPLPHGLHRSLFGRSRAWEFLTLATARPTDFPRAQDEAYREVIAWSAAQGIPLLLVEAAPLDVPFETTVAVRDQELARMAAGLSTPTPSWTAQLERFARTKGVPYVLQARLLADQDVTAIRRDLCCHLNDEGHAALAAALLPHVRELLAATRPAEPGAAPADAVTRPSQDFREPANTTDPPDGIR